MAARAFVWLGGALFVVSLGFCAWTYAVPFGRALPFTGWPAMAVDAVLITVFALHHSVFARDGIKTRITRLVPVSLLRSTYVWIASTLLVLVCAMWRPIGGEVYRAQGLLALALAGAQVAGLWLTVKGTSRLDPLELAGIHPPRESEGLQVSGPFRWIRHPLYLGWLLMVFGAAHMTGDRLAFAAITTLYLVVAIPLEERSLRRAFGDDYIRYTREVRWRMVPFIY
jgi:protein-S-isoprenylcysteine O-methyltransferase Ste14